MPKKHLNIIIYGMVQGVSFRFWIEKKAQELGLTGFVRNEPNNSVYIEIEGEEAALKEFEAWCHYGPDTAQVDKIDVEYGEMNRFEKFTTEY